MTLRMLVDGLHEEETRLAIADDDTLIEFDIESSFKKQNKGNIYLAKVTRVEPSLQAAFVEYGSGRQGFLPFSEIHPDYYQIPVADKQDLLRAQAEQREEENRKVEEEIERESQNENSESLNDSGIQEISTSEEFGDMDNNVDDESQLPNEEELSINEQILPLPQDMQHDADHAEETQPPANTEGVEDLDHDEVYERPRRPNIRRYKIQEVIKKNQIVLIQVIKEERGNKGASVTTYISLPGRYCVLMPNTNRGGGVSRKINDVKERRKLKETIEGLDLKDGMSLIVRTNGMGRTKADITRDYSYLIKLWNKIREDTLVASAPSLVHEEGNIIKRGLRDFYSNDVEEVLIAGEKTFETAREFMKLIMPAHGKKIEHYTDAVPIFNKFGIERHLASMNDSMVTLPNGGYIVINTTEALISIDVNSGRATSERNVEDTATRTNIDAAHEIARQLRLRDLAGLIVIDFIDMMDSRHRRSVERHLKDALRSDRAKIQVGRISPFGLLEMSRQRLRPSLTEINMIECPTCKGGGIIRSNDSAMVQLARSIENELAVAKNEGQQITKVTVTTSAAMALYFLNQKRKYISELETTYNFDLVVDVAEMSPASFRIQLEDSQGGKSRLISSDDRDNTRLPQSRGEKGKRNNNNRRERGRERDRKPRDFAEPQESAHEGEGNVETVEDFDREPGNNNGDRRNGRRRNRNRNRNRNRSRDRQGEPQADNAHERPGENIEAVVSEPDRTEVSTHLHPDEIPVRHFEPGKPVRMSFAPKKTTPRAPRQAKKPPVDSGEEASQGYAEKPVPEITHASEEGDSGKQGDGRKGWWRKIIE